MHASHPQGMMIVPSTGRVTWNTSLVTSGYYSTLVIVQDTFSGVNVSYSKGILTIVTYMKCIVVGGYYEQFDVEYTYVCG